MKSIARLVASVSVPRFAEHPLRTALTVFGITLGVAVLVAVILVNRSILGSVRGTIDEISGKADLEVVAGPGGVDEALLEIVEAVPGVYKATIAMEQVVRVAPDEVPTERPAALTNQSLVLVGAEFLDEDDEYFRPYGAHDVEAVRADPIAFLNSRTNILLSETFAQAHGFAKGDTIRLLTPRGTQAFTIWGLLSADRLGRSVGGRLAVMYYAAMQAAFDCGDRVDRIDVAAAPGVDVAVLQARLSQALGPGPAVERPTRRAERMEIMLAGFRWALLAGSVMALVVGLFLIFNTVSISVVQRKTEIGILRALGTTRAGVTALFASEALVMGAVGSLIGIVAGLYLARVLLVATSQALSDVYTRIEAQTVVLDPTLIAAAAVLGIGGTLVSALAPARHAGRITPIETIRAAVEPLHTRRRRGWILDAAGVAVLAIAAVFTRLPPVGNVPVFGMLACSVFLMGMALLMPRIVVVVQLALRPVARLAFGVTGQLANENVARDLPRAAVTAGALMMAIGMTLCFAVYMRGFERSLVDWVEESIPADLMITSGSRIAGADNTPMSFDLYPFFTHLDGVTAVDCVRIANVPYRDRTIRILSDFYEVYAAHAKAMIVRGDPATATAKLSAGEGVFISENLASRYGLDVGSTITLPSPGGAVDLPIFAVVTDYTSDQGLVYVDRNFYTSTWKDTRVDVYQLYLAQGADLSNVRRQVEKGLPAFDLFILSNSEFRRETTTLVENTFRVLNALELVTMIIALLGVLNAMLANVLDRVREIGVLRAIGTVRRQVRRLIMIEAGILGLASLLPGTGAGFVVGWVMLTSVNQAQTGWTFPFSVPWSETLSLAALSIIVSVVAAWYPARKAAAIRITEALGYE